MEVLGRIEQQVEAVSELSRELKGESSYRGLERLVQLTIQSVLDLGLMVLSALDLSANGYRDVATKLNRLSLIGFEDAEMLRDMAGLRNILVHGYVGVNREIVVESSERLPEDAVRLADEILSSSQSQIDDPPKNVSPLAERLRRVLKGRVKAAFIFGSKVKGYSLRGDVDIALYFGRQPDPYRVGGLMSDIRDFLGREDVDILVIDSCENMALAYKAVHGHPVLGSEAEIVELKTKIASQYMDYDRKLSDIKSLMAKD